MGDYSIDAQLTALNDHLLRERDLLIEANRNQTRRNWRLLKEKRALEGSRRLLEEIFSEAELHECGDTGEKGFVVALQLWDRVGSFLADLAARLEDNQNDGREVR